MRAAEGGEDDPLDADIAFQLAILRASKNPFYAQFRDVVATALRTSIRFTNRIKGAHRQYRRSRGGGGGDRDGRCGGRRGRRCAG